jgi:hypothetical protein
MKHINSQLKGSINRPDQLLRHPLKLSRNLFHNSPAHLRRRLPLQAEVDQYHGAQQELVELGLGLDERRQGRVDAPRKRVGGHRHAERPEEVELLALLRRPGAWRRTRGCRCWP